MEYIITNGELYHHGVKGQKWGIRRYQNPDGTLTAAGRARYGSEEAFNAKQAYKQANKEFSKAYDKAYWLNAPLSISKKRRENTRKRWEDVYDKAVELDKAKKEYKTEKGKVDINKALNKVEKDKEKILDARAANEAKLKAKLAQKVASGKISKEYANARKEDFEVGTEMVKKGYEKYASVIKNYKSLKVSAINDPSVKKSSEYKEAGKAYSKQVLSNMYYGPSGTILFYAADAGKNMRQPLDEYYDKK